MQLELEEEFDIYELMNDTLCSSLENIGIKVWYLAQASVHSIIISLMHGMMNDWRHVVRSPSGTMFDCKELFDNDDKYQEWVKHLATCLWMLGWVWIGPGLPQWPWNND